MMTKQELDDHEFYVNLRLNVQKIELAQEILRRVHAIEINTPLKEAMASLEKARQLNHRYLCTAGERINKATDGGRSNIGESNGSNAGTGEGSDR